MSELMLTPPIEPTKRRRGRPPGARNRRSIDLARYIEARFQGLTPGQILAEMCMPTSRELKKAGSIGKAMAAKARELADELKISPADGMAILVKQLFELAPYVHQRRSPAPVEAPEAPLPGVVVLEAGGESATFDLSGEFDPDTIEVGDGKSDGWPQAPDDAEDLAGSAADGE